MKSIIRIGVCVSVCALALETAARIFAAEQAPGRQPPLRVGVAAELPPMIYKEGKKIVGVEADLAQALGRALGRPVQFVEVRWPDLIDSLEANKIDIIMSSMSVTRARQTRVAFSEPYLRVGQMALVRGEEKFKYSGLLSSLATQTLGVKRGTTGDLVAQQDFPRAKRKYFDSGDDAANALKKKKIDLYLSDSTLIWYLAGKYEAEGLAAAPLILSDEVLAWAVRRTDSVLLDSVNRALKDMNQKGELQSVLRRWIPKFE